MLCFIIRLNGHNYFGFHLLFWRPLLSFYTNSSIHSNILVQVTLKTLAPLFNRCIANGYLIYRWNNFEAKYAFNVCSLKHVKRFTCPPTRLISRIITSNRNLLSRLLHVIKIECGKPNLIRFWRITVKNWRKYTMQSSFISYILQILKGHDHDFGQQLFFPI